MAKKDIAIKFVVGEAVLFFIILTAVGFYFNPKDPLFIHSTVNPFVLLELTITLFYGLTGGLVFLVAAVPVFRFIYPQFPLSFLLWTLLLVLIAGEFFSYWKRRIELSEEESTYFKSKLRKQTNDFILLKLSHDQLEKHYLVKPISIRTVLEKIKKELINNREKAFGNLMNLISEAFFVRRGTLYCKTPEGNFKLAASIGEPVKLDMNDPLIREAIEEERTVFLSSSSSQSNYLAVVPVFDISNDDEIIAFFLIKDLPFRYLNADNILSINVALIWFMAELEKTEMVKDLVNEFRYLPVDFIVEVQTVKILYEKFGIDSYMVVYKIPENLKDIIQFIQNKIRGVDFLVYHKVNNCYMVYILLPLSSLSSAEGFSNRISNELKRRFGSEIKNKITEKFIKVDREIYKSLKEETDRTREEKEC
ncbi:PelD GGDEF domain-containing protein [Desulfurobacterium sp.]